MDNREMIAAAADRLNPHHHGDRLFGDVAAVLVTAGGSEFVGVCIDTACGTGFCAEAAAIGAMVSAGEYAIARIVAVWRDDRDGKLYVLRPCGRCREFIRQIDDANLDTEVILGVDEAMPLRNLLPRYEWPTAVES